MFIMISDVLKRSFTRPTAMSETRKTFLTFPTLQVYYRTTKPGVYALYEWSAPRDLTKTAVPIVHVNAGTRGYASVAGRDHFKVLLRSAATEMKQRANGSLHACKIMTAADLEEYPTLRTPFTLDKKKMQKKSDGNGKKQDKDGDNADPDAMDDVNMDDDESNAKAKKSKAMKKGGAGPGAKVDALKLGHEQLHHNSAPCSGNGLALTSAHWNQITKSLKGVVDDKDNILDGYYNIDMAERDVHRDLSLIDVDDMHLSADNKRELTQMEQDGFFSRESVLGKQTLMVGVDHKQAEQLALKSTHAIADGRSFHGVTVWTRPAKFGAFSTTDAHCVMEFAPFLEVVDMLSGHMRRAVERHFKIQQLKLWLDLESV